MGEVAITAGNVQPGTGVTLKKGTAGATITAGMSVYKDSTDSNHLKATDADAVASAACVGIAMHGAADGQPLNYQDEGSYTVGGTVVLGQPYVVSQTTAGSLALFSDLAAADYCTLVIVATSTTVATISLVVTGGVKA